MALIQMSSAEEAVNALVVSNQSFKFYFRYDFVWFLIKVILMVGERVKKLQVLQAT